MEILQNEYIRITLALLISAIGNIILGTATANVEKKFEFKKFWQGILKAFLIWLSMLCVYLVGELLPNITVLNIDNTEVTVQIALNTVIIGAVVMYIADILAKLGKLFNLKSKES